MKADMLFLELEQILEQLGYRTRKERGVFLGSDCLIEGDKIVMVNKNKPIESQLRTLATALSQISLEGVFIKPAIRKELEQLWGQLHLPSGFSDDWGTLE